MKAFLCILGVILTTASVNCDLPEELVGFVKECIAQLKLSEDISAGVSHLMKTYKCFSTCISKKAGYLIDGKIDPETAYKWIKMAMPSANADGTLDKVKECATTGNEKSEVREIVSTFHKCIMEKVGNVVD